MKTAILTGSIRKGRQSHKVAIFLKTMRHQFYIEQAGHKIGNLIE